MKLCMCIMALEPISTAYLKNPSHQSVFVRISFESLQGNASVKFIPPFGTRQRLGKEIPVATNSHNNRRTVQSVIFYAVRVLSKESLWVCLCIPLSLLGNNSVKTIPRPRRTVGAVVFYAVCVVSKKAVD
jgi:hypothetical protein